MDNIRNLIEFNRNFLIKIFIYQHHGQTIHPTKILFSGNLFKIPGVLTWAWFFWLLRLLRLLEAKNGQSPSSEGLKSLKEWIFWNTYLIKVAHQPQKPLSGSNQIWARTSGKKDRGQCSKSWGCMIQQHSQSTMLSAANM